MSEHPAAFVPLLSRSGTRLVALEHSNEGINASLLAIDLDDASCPAYEAISYTWADELAETEIAVNGVSVSVRPQSLSVSFQTAAIAWRWSAPAVGRLALHPAR